MWWVTLHKPPSVLLAVRLAVDLEVAIAKHDTARLALEAAGVVLDRGFVFQVLSFDATAAAAAQTAVELVVVEFAIRAIVEYVKC